MSYFIIIKNHDEYNIFFQKSKEKFVYFFKAPKSADKNKRL